MVVNRTALTATPTDRQQMIPRPFADEVSNVGVLGEGGELGYVVKRNVQRRQLSVQCLDRGALFKFVQEFEERLQLVNTRLTPFSR